MSFKVGSRDVAAAYIGTRTFTSGYVGGAPITGGRLPIPAPSLLDYTPPFALQRMSSGQITTDYDPSVIAFDAGVVQPIYLDPVSGFDGNDGLTAGAPKKNLASCLALNPGGVDTLQIELMLSTSINARSNIGWNNTQPVKNIIFSNETGHKFRIVKASASLLTWSVNGTYADVFSATTSAPSGLVDASISAQPTITIPSGRALSVDGIWRIGDGVTPITINNAPPVYDIPRKVASLVAVHDAVGSAWYHDGTQLHAKAADGRSLIGDANFLATASGSSGKGGAQNNQKILLRNIDFLGGGTPFDTNIDTSVTGQEYFFDNVSFQGGGSGNGMVMQGTMVSTAYRCGFYNNWTDGSNYHSFETDGTTLGTSPKFHEIECVTKGNGTTGSGGTSDNDTTSHDDCRGVRVNSLYLGSDDRVLVDVNFARAWNLGCFTAKPVQLAAIIALADSAKGFFDTCVLEPSENTQVSIAATAEFNYSHMPLPTFTGGGTPIEYDPTP